MSVLHSQIEADGRPKLPPQIMRHIALQAGSDLEFRVENGSAQAMPSTHERVRRVQEKMKKYIRPGISVVDEFIAERRRETENE